MCERKGWLLISRNHQRSSGGKMNMFTNAGMLLSTQSGSHGAPQSGEPARKTIDEWVAKPPILSHSYPILFLSRSYHTPTLSNSYLITILFLFLFLSCPYSYPYPTLILFLSYSYLIPILSYSYLIHILFLSYSYPIPTLFL